MHVDVYICQDWQPWYEREIPPHTQFCIHIPPGSCISFSTLLSLAFYLESRLKIYKAINNGFPAGGEGLWWWFCDCLNHLHSCSIVSPFGCLPYLEEGLMARSPLYLLITLCSIKEITNLELIHQLFPQMMYQIQDGAALALVYYCYFCSVITVMHIIMHIACLVIDCSFCSFKNEAEQQIVRNESAIREMQYWIPNAYPNKCKVFLF